MQQSLRSLLSIVFFFITTTFSIYLLRPPEVVHAEPMREFVMSCTYGVLAGTLVGAATLAFTDKPGDNLNRVARGASLGLYSGILLGFYVVYGVPEEEDNPDMIIAPRANLDSIRSPKWMFLPQLSQAGSVTGASLQWQMLF